MWGETAIHTSDIPNHASADGQFPAVLQNICRDAAQALHGDWAALLLYDDLADSFTLAALYGMGGAQRLVGQVLPASNGSGICRALESATPIALSSNEAFPATQEVAASFDRHPVLLVPMLAPSPVGVLLLDRTHTDLSDAERSQALRVGAEAGHRIQAARPDAGHYCLFRRIVNVAPAGVAVVEGPDHIFSYASPSFRQMLGLDTVPFLGRSAQDVMPSSTLGKWMLDEVRRNGQPQAAGTEVPDSPGNRFYEVHVIPEHGPSGATAALFIILWPRTDVVQTRRALEATIVQLADSQNTLSAVLDSTVNGILFVSPDGTILYANRRVGELLGIDPHEAVGKNKLELMESELLGRMADPEGFADRLRGIYAELDSTAVDEIEVLSPTRRILQRYSGPVYKQDGTHLGRIDVYSDMTEVRDLQQNKDEFLSLVSHELKTPVTSIKGYIQLLRKRAAREPAPSQTLTAYEVIERQTERMQNLIEMLLDLSRLESGRLTLQRAPVEVGALLKEAVGLAGMTTDDHEIQLEAPDKDVWIDADGSRLEQVITNLLSNAIRYSPDGGPIEVTLTADNQDVQIRVRDHGTGIAPDALPRVFERFYRAGHASHEAGMGIGLFIARGIVEEHGGRIDVSSELGQGSTFTVILPASHPL